MAQNLTVKQRKFIKAMMEHGNITQAVIDAGYKHKDRDSASSIGWVILRKLRPYIADVMEMRGIDDTRLSKVLDDGLDATKIEMVKDADGNQKFGMVTDHYVRHKFLETALKVKGGFAPLEHRVAGKDGGPIEIKPKGSIFDKLDKYAKLFESNGGREEGPAPGDGAGEQMDSTPADDKAG